MGSENLYRTAVGSTEQNRLEKFEEPTRVSIEILDGLEFTSLIDAGAGPSSKLAEYVTRQRREEYIGFDLREDYVKTLSDKLAAEGISARILQADIRDISSKVRCADIVHERFVLAHLSEDDRRVALQELLEIANSKVILLEYNWRPMKSTEHARLFQQFMDASFKFFEPLHFDPFFGETMQAVVREIAGGRNMEFKRFLRPEGDYSSELVQLCRVQSVFARNSGKELLAADLTFLANQFENLPITFVPAEIDTVIISI